MRLGRIEILLLLLVVCGTVFMAIQYFPGGGPKVCAPVPLSPEVKAYIDQKIAANAGNAQCGDIPAAVSRVSDLEVKMESFAKFEEMRVGLQEKRTTLNTAIQDSRAKQTDVLAAMRNAELGRLRSEAAMMCSGISARSSGAAGGGANGGIGGKRGGPGQVKGAGKGKGKGKGKAGVGAPDTGGTDNSGGSAADGANGGADADEK